MLNFSISRFGKCLLAEKKVSSFIGEDSDLTQKAMTKATKGEATFKWHFDMSGEKALLFYLWRNRDNIFLISAEIAVINML